MMRDIDPRTVDCVRNALENMPALMPVKTRHEGYGVIAERNAVLMQTVKEIKKQMDKCMDGLSESDTCFYETVSGLRVMSMSVAIAAMEMTNEAQNVLDSLERENRVFTLLNSEG